MDADCSNNNGGGDDDDDQWFVSALHSRQYDAFEGNVLDEVSRGFQQNFNVLNVKFQFVTRLQ